MIFYLDPNPTEGILTLMALNCSKCVLLYPRPSDNNCSSGKYLIKFLINWWFKRERRERKKRRMREKWKGVTHWVSSSIMANNSLMSDFFFLIFMLLFVMFSNILFPITVLIHGFSGKLFPNARTSGGN